MERGVSSTRADEKKTGTRGARGPTKKNEPQADEKSLRPKPPTRSYSIYVDNHSFISQDWTLDWRSN